MGDATSGNPSSNAFYLTLGEAARRVGLNKSTLSRAVKDGRLSAVRCAETNSYKIDPAELHRYAESVAVVRNNAVAQADPQQPATGNQPAATLQAMQIELLEERKAREIAEARVAMAETQLAEVKSMLSDMRIDRDRWHEHAATAMRLLPGPRNERRRWWGWLKRAG